MGTLDKKTWAFIAAVLAILVFAVANANVSNQTNKNQKARHAETVEVLQEAKNKAIESRQSTQKELEASQQQTEAAEAREATEKAEKERLQGELQSRANQRAEAARVAAAEASKRVAAIRAPATQPQHRAGGNLAGCESMRPLVAQYDWQVDTMMRIMKAESGCNPGNHNFADNHRSCLGSYGLFQIGCVHGLSVAAMSDPAQNVAAAYRIFKSQGYGAWTTY